jgi:Flp pilus assembly protein TadD
LLAHVVGKSVLEVEFVNDAQAHVAAGRAHLGSGDLEDALKEFARALDMDAKNAGAHLGRGIAFKLRGDKEAARREFLLAEAYDPRGDDGREARRHLDNLG